MTSYAYGLVLAAWLAALLLVDWRWKLAWWYNARRTAQTIALAVGFFLLWDIAGVALGIFYTGTTSYLSGAQLLPQVPIEELGFLTGFCYLTLLLWRGWQKYGNLSSS